MPFPKRNNTNSQLMSSIVFPLKLRGGSLSLSIFTLTTGLSVELWHFKIQWFDILGNMPGWQSQWLFFSVVCYLNMAKFVSNSVATVHNCLLFNIQGPNGSENLCR